MSDLVYDHLAKELTLFDREHVKVGAWKANNRVESTVVRASGLPSLPNGIYAILEEDSRHPFHHAQETSRTSYGPMGIVRLEPFIAAGKRHEGVGIHAGRKHFRDPEREGIDHPTRLCIRTTDTAMSMIKLTAAQDHLKTLLVRNSLARGLFVKNGNDR